MCFFWADCGWVLLVQLIGGHESLYYKTMMFPRLYKDHPKSIGFMLYIYLKFDTPSIYNIDTIYNICKLGYTPSVPKSKIIIDLLKSA